jgi:hypothetical protein
MRYDANDTSMVLHDRISNYSHQARTATTIDHFYLMTGHEFSQLSCMDFTYTSSIPSFDPQKTASEVIGMLTILLVKRKTNFFIFKIHCFIFADNNENFILLLNKN